MSLTITQIKNAKPAEKAYKLFDGRGLHLEVAPSGGKWWRFKYRYEGKDKRISLGVYPDVSLEDARKRRDEARQTLAQGIDPSAVRKAAKALENAKTETFEVIANEWHKKFSPAWTPKHSQKILTSLRIDVFPWLGTRPIKEIAAPELLTVIRRVESRGVLETAHRVLGYCGSVFRYAVATGRAERDPAGDLRGALPPVKVTHHPAITEPLLVGELLRAIDGYTGSFVVHSALRLLPYVFVRPGELRHAEWAEFDLDDDNPVWRIPEGKMKMRRSHIVPLSHQAVAILKELHSLTGSGRYCFPSERTKTRPMSDNTLNAALRRLGYSRDEMTAHGWRTTASTILNEQGWPADAIEMQLAHVQKNKVRAVYNQAQYLPERQRMMQAWAEYMDSLRSGGKVLLFNIRRIDSK
jgi:integrase